MLTLLAFEAYFNRPNSIFIANTPPLQYCTGLSAKTSEPLFTTQTSILGSVIQDYYSPTRQGPIRLQLLDDLPHPPLAVTKDLPSCRRLCWSVWKTGGKFPKESTYRVPFCWIHTWPRSRDRQGCSLNIILGRVVVPDQWPGCRSVVHML